MKHDPDNDTFVHYDVKGLSGIRPTVLYHSRVIYSNIMIVKDADHEPSCYRGMWSAFFTLGGYDEVKAFSGFGGPLQ